MRATQSNPLASLTLGSLRRQSDADAGFTLIEMICALAIVGLIAALALPRWSNGTSHAQMEGYAVAIAALLKGDRNAAIRAGSPVETSMSAAAHVVRSGAGTGIVTIPGDVDFDATLAERCAGRRSGAAIDFFPSGSSCGGTIAIARQGAGYQIRVNWLTGGVDVVPFGKN